MSRTEITSDGYWRDSREIIAPTWKSKENGVKMGDIRMIEGVLFSPTMIDRRFLVKDIVHWQILNHKSIKFNFDTSLDLGNLFWLYHQLDIDKLKDDYNKEK